MNRIFRACRETGRTIRRINRRLIIQPRKIVFALVPTAFLLAMIQIISVVFSGYISAGFRAIQFSTIADSILEADYDEFFVSDPELFWRLKPSTSAARPDLMFNGLVANVLGLRNEWDDFPEGQYVLCLGDSSTFGYGLEYSEAWPAQLEYMLHESGMADVNVINAGVPGYTSHQGRIVYSRLRKKIRPDWVIVQFSWNDGGLWGNKTDREHGYLIRSRESMRSDSIWRSLGSRLFSLNDMRIVSAWIKHRLGNKVELYQPGSVPRVPSCDYLENLHAMCNMAEEDAAQLILVEWPLYFDEYGGYGPGGRFYPASYREEQRYIADNTEALLVEMYPRFRDLPVDRIYRDMGHGNAEGYRMLAEKLAAVIISAERRSN